MLDFMHIHETLTEVHLLKPTPLGNFLLKILKFRDKQFERLRLTGSSVNQVKVIDMSTGGEEKKDDSKWMPPDQKYRQNKK